MELFDLATKVLLKNNENNQAYTLKAEPSTVATIFPLDKPKYNSSLILFSFFLRRQKTFYFLMEQICDGKNDSSLLFGSHLIKYSLI